MAYSRGYFEERMRGSAVLIVEKAAGTHLNGVTKFLPKIH